MTDPSTDEQHDEQPAADVEPVELVDQGDDGPTAAELDAENTPDPAADAPAFPNPLGLPTLSTGEPVSLHHVDQPPAST